MAAVKIALRVRPLSEREKLEDQSSLGVIEVEDDQTVAVTNLKVPTSNAGDSRARVKRFNFDYCFDSTSPEKENYATEETIFEKIGALVLKSASEGRDACVMAYGQSASGKTHTMQGSKSHPGLVPRLCEALLKAQGDEPIQATLSYFEIYNERVRDLLAGEDLESSTVNHTRKDLRVREHPKKGPYVEDLTNLEINSGEELCSAWWNGARRRRTASTATNARSSRSHALLRIRRNLPYPPVVLTLLDLAGSERPSRANQSLPRQKEGANINKSLVALANVISALVSVGPRGSGYVPYRDSVLTWLLKDTLSGGATTVMIATVSPSSACYSETVNTMRWAARAARIPPGSSRTPDAPHERVLRQLRAEVARLRALLAAATANNTSNSEQLPNQEEPSEMSEPTLKCETENSIQAKLNEGEDSIDSLASSMISLASMDTLSGNNSNPSTQGSNLNSSQAEDLFGPRLHRAGSVHDVKPSVPLRSKKRQYSSHEVLPSNDKHNKKPNSITKAQTKPSKVDVQDKNNDSTKQKVAVVYQPFNKRAEIVASVTDRLYSKLNKKEEKIPKPPAPTVERKSSQPLNELQICNNARKKLYDLSYRALKASRRYKVVPAETQTEKPSALRVREVGTDVPNDIEIFSKDFSQINKMFKNVSTSTEIQTMLCKEVSVGRIDGSIHINHVSVETDKTPETSNLIMTRTCGNMTEEICNLTTIATQTQEAPPRKKHSSFTKYLKVPPALQSKVNDGKTSPTVLNISISHDCNSLDNELDCISDDSLELEAKSSDAKQIVAPPDLLNNHNSNENISNVDNNISGCSNEEQDKHKHVIEMKESNSFTYQSEQNKIDKISFIDQNEKYNNNSLKSKSIQLVHEATSTDFIDDLNVPLPRIFFNTEYCADHWPTMKNIILGRNENIYPYNIKLSPAKEPPIKRRLSKTVSWKNEVENYTVPSTSSVRQSSMKKSPKNDNYSSESDTLDSDDIKCEDLSDSDKTTDYFKGIYCWGDKSPYVTPRKRKRIKQSSHNKDCTQYAKVTSEFITEATNLVSALTKISDKIKEPTSNNIYVSPNCNASLHARDETKNVSKIEDIATSIENIVKSMNCSRIINDSLVNNDEHNKSKYYTSEDDRLETAEKDLLDSLSRLENCRKTSSEYFNTMNDRYRQKFNRTLPNIPNKSHVDENLSYKCSRRYPSDYLKQLLELRKDLVESTKRDENICKSFQMK